MTMICELPNLGGLCRTAAIRSTPGLHPSIALLVSMLDHMLTNTPCCPATPPPHGDTDRPGAGGHGDVDGGTHLPAAALVVRRAGVSARDGGAPHQGHRRLNLKPLGLKFEPRCQAGPTCSVLPAAREGEGAAYILS